MHNQISLLFIAVLILPCALMVQPVHSSTEPSVPEFTVEVVHRSYDHPAIYSIDPYTGQNITIVEAKRDYQTEIVVTIENQPFAAYRDSDGNWIELFYNVQSKGHFSDSWTTVSYMYDVGWLKQSDSGYTQQSYSANSTPAKARVDFRVQTMIGYFHDVYTGQTLNGYSPVFVGETSGWSSTQTITISDESATPTVPPSSSGSTANPSSSASENPTSTANPSVSGDSTLLFGLDLAESVIIVFIGVIVVLLVFVVFYLRRSLK